MSKLSEYLKLIPKGIKNGTSILEAMYKDTLLEKGKLPEDEMKEILRRRFICLTCPFNSAQAIYSQEYLSLTGQHYHTDRMELHCSLCGCPEKYRTAALDKNCGIEDWNEEHPGNTLELKWIKYK